MHGRLFGAFGLAALLTLGASAKAQIHERVWYAGNASNQLLLDFATAPPTVTCKGVVGARTGFEGGAVWTTPAGALKLYTDGLKLYNGSTNALISGTLAANATTTEPALMVPKPGGTADEFYVFTNNAVITANGTVAYHLVDLAGGGAGTITPSTTVGTWNSGEALGFFPHANGSDFWVLTFDTRATIRAYQVTATGVSATPVTSSTGLVGNAARGSIVHSPKVTRLALGLSGYSGVQGLIATADFNQATGSVSNVVTHVTGAVGYSVTWSPDSTKLYYTDGSEGWNGTPKRVRLSDNNIVTVKSETGWGGAKLGVDGKIYYTGNSKTSFLVVDNPDATTPTTSTLSAGGCTLGFNLPNQTGSSNLPPEITSDGGEDDAFISIPENTTPVTTVTATDPNTGQTLTFSISGGVDAALFDINPTTGALVFKTAPDFEAPTDTGKDNVYEVTVQVCDPLNACDTQNINVAVTDVPETGTGGAGGQAGAAGAAGAAASGGSAGSAGGGGTAASGGAGGSPASGGAGGSAASSGAGGSAASSGSGGGSAAAGGSQGGGSDSSGDDGGCGCRTPGEPPSPASSWWLALGGLLLLARRRRASRT